MAVSVERIESRAFPACRELYLHSVEEGDAERLVGFALSEGSTTTLLERGVSEAELGLDRLRDVAARGSPDRPVVAQLRRDRRSPARAILHW